MKNETEKILEVNKRQKDYYNSPSTKRNFLSKIWASARNGLLNNFRTQFDIKNKVYQQHKIWLGDISNKKILDLGCLRGNALSIYMAKNAKEYIGIDLSDVAIAELNKRLILENCNNAKAIAIDFLSPDFIETEFDIIYAYGVLHHFENVDILISKLKEKLKDDGVIISYDPLETSLPIKILRLLYRPFQSDKDWEWPFKKSTLEKFNKNFSISEKKGILGKSKYGIFINMLPLKKTTKTRIIKKLIDKDWNLTSFQELYSCMHVTMLMKKLKEQPHFS
jgi:2-polyprenyl-3-methyl-5-hydroxy-6-metoxy-1,4-benzoquinol methylase